MKRLLYAATAICGLAVPAIRCPPITGDINFDGNVGYTSATVDFLGTEGVVQQHQGAGGCSAHAAAASPRDQHHLLPHSRDR